MPTFGRRRVFGSTRGPFIAPIRSTGAAAGNTISSADLTFGFSESATLTETFSASGGVAFGFSEAAVLSETFSLSGGPAFSFSETASLAETFSLSAGLSFPFAESTALNTPLDRDLSVALSFGFSESAVLQGPDLGGYSGNKGGARISPYVIPRKPNHLYADLAFGFGLHARLKETDDELALVLGAF